MSNTMTVKKNHKIQKNTVNGVKTIDHFFKKKEKAELKDRCELCHFHCSLRGCSTLHKYCEKHFMYYDDRAPYHVYDTFYKKWLPVHPSVSNFHYENINLKRNWVRNFDMQKYTQHEKNIENFKIYLELVELFYPNFMTDLQKDCSIAMKNGIYIQSITKQLIQLLPH